MPYNICSLLTVIHQDCSRTASCADTGIRLTLANLSRHRRLGSERAHRRGCPGGYVQAWYVATECLRYAPIDAISYLHSRSRCHSCASATAFHHRHTKT